MVSSDILNIFSLLASYNVIILPLIYILQELRIFKPIFSAIILNVKAVILNEIILWHG